MEVQAFGRVARIGQTKETYLAKIMATETIEVDMVNLQSVKVEDIGMILKEKKGTRRDITMSLLGGLLRLLRLNMKMGKKTGGKKK